MNIRPGLVLSFCVLSLVAPPARGESAFGTVECHKSAAFFVSSGMPGGRQYAPDREVDVLHLALTVTPDFTRRTVTGQAEMQFKPLLKPLRELRLDAVELNIQSVESSRRIQAYQVADDKLIITFREPVPVDEQTVVTVVYSAEPVKGLYFRTPEMGYKPGEAHIFTQGEPIEARHWYPCFDAPNEFLTSEIICRVPDGMTVISNGRLVSQRRDEATGLTAFHWSQEKPHVNYLITLVAGPFVKIEDRHRDIPLAFYTLPSQREQAMNSFRDTRDMMEFFEREIGLPYPWPKYDQICVNDFVAGGMENTSATTLTDNTLFSDETENLRSSEGLVAHELAHQWFGDLVTCKDWSDLWLNEGFATYYQSLYNAHKNGRDAMLYELYQRARQIAGMANDTNAIVRRTYADPADMFNYLAYPKGSWVLHMLRSQLGSDLFRRCIRTYLERHQHGNVVTEDLRKVIEELTGRPHDRFFDQWLYHAHHPEIEATYSWDEKTKLARIAIRQTQTLMPNVLLFHFPLTIRFKHATSSVDRIVQITRADEEFYFPLEAAPEIVRLDPDYTLLAKVNFPVPTPLLHAQLADATDVIGRLLAIEQLAKRSDQATVARLRQALNNDAFFGVRREAAAALRSINSETALDALLGSTAQPDARARHAVVEAIGGFYREKAYASARQTLVTEKNPAIAGAALRSLAGFGREETRAQILTSLNTPSYRNERADDAIAAMRLQDDPAHVAPLLEALSRRESEFTTRGFSQALGTLAYLARNEENKDAVREFLLGRLNHPKIGVRRAALAALGTLSDPKAIGAVEKFATAAKDGPERTAAEAALSDLRRARRPVDDFKNLRQEVLDLQKANRELRRELDSLKKSVEGLGSGAAAENSKRSPGSRR